MPRKTQRPIVTIRKPISAKIYRARFKPLEATRRLSHAVAQVPGNAVATRQPRLRRDKGSESDTTDRLRPT